MFWAALIVSLVVVAGLVVALMLRARRRLVRVPRTEAMMAGSGGDSIYGLSPRELDDFRAMAREQSRDHRERWNRDYPNGASVGMPGRVSGIPRALRVKR